MAKQLSLLSHVKTPNLACNKDSRGETAAGESTICEEKWRGLEDIEEGRSNEEGKVEVLKTDIDGEEEELVVVLRSS